MGASQSTRNLPDPVYVKLCVEEDGYVRVIVWVASTENRLKLRSYARQIEETEWTMEAFEKAF